jgi:hypothetical protein
MKVPLLQNPFWGDERKFLEPLMEACPGSLICNLNGKPTYSGLDLKLTFSR